MANNKNFGFKARALLGTAGIVFALSAGPALAGSISTTSVSLANGSQTVNITDTQQSVDGGGSNVIAGTIQLQTNIGVLNTYCVDMFDYISVGNPENYTFSQSQLTAGSTFRNGTATGTFTQAQVNDLTALLINAGSLASTSAVDSAALQVAVWEIEYDTAAGNGSYTIGQSGGSDPFYMTSTGSGSTSALSLAQTWLNDVTGYQNGSNWVSATWLTNSNYVVDYLTASGTQNLIYLANNVASAPEPSSIGVIGVGLLGLWAARRRKLI